MGGEYQARRTNTRQNGEGKRKYFSDAFAATNAGTLDHCPLRNPGKVADYSRGAFGGVSMEVRIISSKTFRNSSRPVAGMMIVSRRPFTSSVILRNLPRGFSLRVKTKVFLSIWILSLFKVSSATAGFGPECPECPECPCPE